MYTLYYALYTLYTIPIYICVHIIQQVYIILLQYNGACTLFGVVFNQRLKMIYDHGGSEKKREREKKTEKKNGENYVSRQRNKVYIYIYILFTIAKMKKTVRQATLLNVCNAYIFPQSQTANRL